MSKYSFDVRRMAVLSYLNGEGTYQQISEKHKIIGTTQLKDWVNLFRVYGENALYPKQNRKKYTVQTKLHAIELYLTSEMSIREVANVMEITTSSLVGEWLTKYRKDGVDGLGSKKGNRSTMRKTKKKDSVEAHATKEDSIRIKELEKQVRQLQIENAYLKESRRLREQEACAKTNGYQESSTTSEDHSD